MIHNLHFSLVNFQAICDNIVMVKFHQSHGSDKTLEKCYFMPLEDTVAKTAYMLKHDW